MENKTVTLEEGEVVVKMVEINQAFRDRDEAIEKYNTLLTRLEESRKANNHNKVLINKTIGVVNKVKKIFPGLANGSFLTGFNPMTLMNNKELEKLGPEFQQLEVLIQEYSKTNAIPIGK
jgi:hypothetical protein